ncbi:MAG: lipoyl synthase [Planctomycetota bacterium]
MKRVSLGNMVLGNAVEERAFIKRKKPDWLRAKLPGGPGFKQTRELIDKYKLHTVCESAKCPNMGECWARGTATMMILGDVCTRSCGFCHIKTGRPPEYDTDEPRRVGEAAAIMNLKHLVVTSVNRDELPDGGAAIWAEMIREVRRQSPETHIEVLIPDFNGDWDALQLVLDERPEILNHNLETVPRLYPAVRPQAKYDRSIELLRRAKAQGLTVKTGIMVGIGERDEEVHQLIDDVMAGTHVPGVAEDSPATNRDPMHVPDPDRPGLTPLADSPATPAAHGVDLDATLAEAAHPHATYPGVHDRCDILTIGQYLQPTARHLPISRWVTPAEFVGFKRVAEEAGFRHCESGPLVRSSYHADEQVLQLDRSGAGA